jgi:hypothetical protein
LALKDVWAWARYYSDVEKRKNGEVSLNASAVAAARASSPSLLRIMMVGYVCLWFSRLPVETWTDSDGNVKAKMMMVVLSRIGLAGSNLICQACLGIDRASPTSIKTLSPPRYFFATTSEK